MSDIPVVSVVVATHDRADRLDVLLTSLEAQRCDFPFEVVVVDDGSTDHTGDVLDRHRTRGGLELRTVSRRSASGPATARDEGWRSARGALIAFTDDDCRAHVEWLAQGRAAALEAPGSIVQGRTERDPDHMDRLGPFSRTIEVLEPDPAFQTCNMLYPRELLERIGGFDIAAFAQAPGGEDADLAWRAIAAGATRAFAPSALVFHEIADLGPIGKLRVAARWTVSMQAYVRHRELRNAHFVSFFFWKQTHAWLARALLGLLLPKRWIWLRAWLAFPYARALRARGKIEGGGALMAPYFLLHDLVEIVAVARAAIRFRRPML